MNSPNAIRTSHQIRSDFLEFFRSKGHTIVPSSPLVPGNDPTLLFTNAGMVQFKDVFLGAEKRSYTRATSSQRCVRAGGKHNDLDQVGYTARHHTFFEMLGNFSFGDYFKRDAIAWAWELLTQVWKLPADRLLVTIYHTDDEAFDIWNQVVGLPPERIIRIGDNKGAPYASDNFWQMADTGPCGPCTEIFYDHGAHIPGGPPGSPDEDGDRFIEIWNNVFMQFDRQPDGTLVPLPAPCVDTGMGLERLCAVLQHVHSNYEIDLFQHLIRAAAKITNTADLEHKSLRVIADHIRACSFLIVDGVLPSNEGRGYVLRRIIRRAVRHFWKLGALQADGAFWRMVAPLCEAMGDAYPELNTKRELVERALKAEEAAFAQTLDAGMQRLEGYLHQSDGALSGEQVFQLHDTYGCPPDLIADILREKGMTLPGETMADYERLMEQQRDRARAAGKFGGGLALPGELIAQLAPTQFEGYEGPTANDLLVQAIVRDGRPVETLRAGESAIVVLDRTPFYAESGGQVGDTGQLATANATFDVRDTLKLAGQFHGHVGALMSGELNVGDRVSGAIDAERRASTVLNHSATHLLHSALRTVLGTHVTQKGSLVAPDRLRFDFSHFQPVSAEELATIERMVNAEVRRNHSTEIHHMGMQEALDFGAMALFGEKYGERVRVLRMGETSTELCGGTHVSRTGDIGLFKIVSEGGVSAGVRRIEAVTGQGALDHVMDEERRLNDAARLLGGNASEVNEKLRALLDRQKKLEREVEQLKAKAASGATSDLAAGAVAVGDVRVLAARLEGFDAKALRDAIDRLKQQLGDAVIVLAGASDGKAALVAGVSGSAAGKVKAGELLAHVASRINGKGGGRPDLAQGGGDDGPALQAALEAVPQWVAERLH
ncbi:Alanyl-tRNA synthetase [Lysobacter dokdonensis DS-58]|uniref:Alanine--tRNA ligase n=1 Tax=Lysobacter dokdonensis DS-58 TaxID=1300345 RepID=A0A0A2WNJ1_9GAMM|nr:alanine--tRNA ligase [Lysobacter dokdonensis]KGQ19860.1 Alanyl-tRNA synthetase [Lysobacter dokdonensis DS-58]